jgi:hypothetical protein
MDGGMVSRPEKASFSKYSAKNKFFADDVLILLRANARSAVLYSARGGRGICALIAAFALKHARL